MRVLIIILAIFTVDSHQRLKKLGSSLFRKFTSAMLAGSFIVAPSSVFADVSLTDQLKSLQTSQVASTKLRVETDESEAILRGIQYPPGFLVGRGLITLVSDDGNGGPYGVPETYLVNPELGQPEATLFVLAVGREGPPLAAKKITNVNSLKFPLIVEVSCEDLLFPYTSSAWQASSNRVDGIAMTAIFSADGKLSTASPSDRLGFGQSEPTNIAGVITRTTAALVANKKIDLTLYSKEEIDLLASIDNEVDRRLLSTSSSAVTAKK